MGVEICFLDERHIERFEEQKAFLYKKWQEHLSGQGVAWPTDKAKGKIAQIVGLSFFVGRPVNKESLGKFAHALTGGSHDVQVRHLRTEGWCVVGSGRGPSENRSLNDGTPMPQGTYALLSFTTPSPQFSRSERLKRRGRAGAQDWGDLCQVYRGRCAHCGKETRNPDKGHMDPNKGADIDNLIPLCPDCNNWASDDVIFGPDGRIVAVLSERFLKTSPPEALRRIRAWLDTRGGAGV
jgi:hypothetical protein